MRSPTVLPGDTYSRLTVLSEADKIPDGKQRNGSPKYVRAYRCYCECGNEITVRGTSLRKGQTRSCGCLLSETSGKRVAEANTTHGLSGHPLYGVWGAMIQRCHNPGHEYYRDYGRRGIYVCDEWRGKDGFVEWLLVVSQLPGFLEPGMTLDRIDNDGPYDISNVRWATWEQQRANQRRTKLVTMPAGIAA